VPISTALYNKQLTSKALRYGMYHSFTCHPQLVSWSLTSLFSTNMAISETKPATHTSISNIQCKTFIKETVWLTS